MPGTAYRRHQRSASPTAASMWPCARHSASNCGDFAGMRMYSTSVGTMAWSQNSAMREVAAAAVIAGMPRCCHKRQKWGQTPVPGVCPRFLIGKLALLVLVALAPVLAQVALVLAHVLAVAAQVLLVAAQVSLVPRDFPALCGGAGLVAFLHLAAQLALVLAQRRLVLVDVAAILARVLAVAPQVLFVLADIALRECAARRHQRRSNGEANNLLHHGRISPEWWTPAERPPAARITREPGGGNVRIVSGCNLPRQRVRAQLDLHRLVAHLLAALVVEQRAGTRGGPEGAALPAGFRIVDAAVDILREKARGIGQPEREEPAVGERVDRVAQVAHRDQHVPAEAQDAEPVHPDVVARLGAAGRPHVAQLRPGERVERPALGAMLARRVRPVQ